MILHMGSISRLTTILVAQPRILMSVHFRQYVLRVIVGDYFNFLVINIVRVLNILKIFYIVDRRFRTPEFALDWEFGRPLREFRRLCI